MGDAGFIALCLGMGACQSLRSVGLSRNCICYGDAKAHRLGALARVLGRGWGPGEAGGHGNACEGSAPAAEGELD